MRTGTKNVSATIAFLIGVKDEPLIERYADECKELLEELSKNQDALTIRYLCDLRTTVMLNYKKTADAIKYNLKNLYSLEWFNQKYIKQLEKWEFEIFHANWLPDQYTMLFNQLIDENINKCRDLFGDWLSWDYVRDLFVIPNYRKNGVLQSEFDIYMGNLDFYPFQRYLHWKPIDCGNMLYNDEKFLKVLYEMHDDSILDSSKFRDAHETTKNSIYDFINNSYSTAIEVDCENSDVYKLFSVLDNLEDDELAKVSKIVLYDDYHTTSGWDWIEKLVNIPVEHIEVERIVDSKSLVDLKMTAGVCRDYYTNSIDSFIILSSDSDFWGLISSLPEAKFLVMYEYTKCGQAIKNALESRGIYYCSIDDFCTQNNDKLKRLVLMNLLKNSLPDFSKLNARDILKQIYFDARIEATDKEKQNFYTKYIKTITLKITESGEMSLQFVE